MRWICATSSKGRAPRGHRASDVFVIESRREGRIGIGITALLTLVALQITSNSSLPEVDYLILLDKLYIASYAFVVLTMAIIVRNSWVDATGDISAAVRADRISLAILTALYIAVSALLMITTLA